MDREIVNRLRMAPHDGDCERGYPSDPCGCDRRTMRDAANGMDRLVKENDELRQLLKDRHHLDPVAITDTLAALDVAGTTTEDAT